MRRVRFSRLWFSPPCVDPDQPASRCIRPGGRLLRRWRRTAGAPTAAFTDQVRASSEAAQTFFNARAAALLTPYAGVAEQAAWGARPLATAEPLLTVPQEVQQLLAVAAAKIGSNINAFPRGRQRSRHPARSSVDGAGARGLRALMDSMAAAKAPLTELIDASDEAEV